MARGIACQRVCGCLQQRWRVDDCKCAIRRIYHQVLKLSRDADDISKLRKACPRARSTEHTIPALNAVAVLLHRHPLPIVFTASAIPVPLIFDCLLAHRPAVCGTPAPHLRALLRCCTLASAMPGFHIQIVPSCCTNATCGTCCHPHLSRTKQLPLLCCLAASGTCHLDHTKLWHLLLD